MSRGWGSDVDLDRTQTKSFLMYIFLVSSKEYDLRTSKIKTNDVDILQISYSVELYNGCEARVEHYYFNLLNI